MTLHIHYNHACANCGAEYIPYNEEVACPRCGQVEEERFRDFAAQAAGSAVRNLRRGRKYVPPVWSTFSLADSLLYFLFELFEAHRTCKEDTSFEAFTADFVDRADFSQAEYLRAYMAPLACRVHEEVERLRGGTGAG